MSFDAEKMRKVYHNILREEQKSKHKIQNKEELYDMLEGYKGILSKEKLDYFKSLIELEFSILKPYISDNERLILSNLDIYREIALYNIYNRALNILSDEDLLFYSSIKKSLSIYSFSSSLDYWPLFNFNFSKKIENDKENNIAIGQINLYSTFNDQKYKEDMISSIRNEYETLSAKQNPYNFISNGRRGNICLDWIDERDNRLFYLDKRLKELTNQEELSEDMLKKIECQQVIFNKLLEDYGLRINDFSQEIDFLSDFGTFGSKKKYEMEKKLVKKYPGIDINTNIKYL